MTPQAAEWCLLFVAPCMPSSEWASWLQAVFSGLAVLAAVAVVAWQEFGGARRRAVAAELVASGILASISQNIGALQAATDALRSRALGETSPATAPKHLLGLLVALAFPSVEELLMLSEKLPRSAVNILQASNATKQVHGALGLFAHLVEAADRQPSADELYGPLAALTADATQALETAHSELDRYLQGRTRRLPA